MTAAKSFLTDLDDAILRGTSESRTRALWHTTDLLIAGRYSDDEIWTFGEVIGRLADEIESPLELFDVARHAAGPGLRLGKTVSHRG